VIVIGIDAHKDSHTLVAIDVSGRKLGSNLAKTSTAGHLQAIRWAHGRFGTEAVWAVRDCRNVTRRLEEDLMMAGYSVTRVPAS
jgi:transposase